MSTPYSLIVPLLGSDGWDGRASRPASPEEQYEGAALGAGSRSKRGSSVATNTACAVALVCTLVNITFLAIRYISTRGASTTELQYASTYIGLEDVLRVTTVSPPPAVARFPVALAQVDSSQPERSFWDTHHHLTTFGTVFPQERDITLSDTVTTFTQFWAGDFAMEQCSLALEVPPPSDVPSLSNETVRVNIWRVQTSRALDLPSLSWNRRPAREFLYATTAIGYNETKTFPKFLCQSGSFQTFELQCVGAGCRMDLHVHPEDMFTGVWMTQNPSSTPSV